MARLHYLTQPAWERGISIIMLSHIKTIAFSAHEKGNERLVYFRCVCKGLWLLKELSQSVWQTQQYLVLLCKSYCHQTQTNKQEANAAPSARQLAEWEGSFAGTVCLINCFLSWMSSRTVSKSDHIKPSNLLLFTGERDMCTRARTGVSCCGAVERTRGSLAGAPQPSSGELWPRWNPLWTPQVTSQFNTWILYMKCFKGALELKIEFTSA